MALASKKHLLIDRCDPSPISGRFNDEMYPGEAALLKCVIT